VVGLNCSTGPEHMRESIRYLSAHTALPIFCVPNAGIPINVEGRAHFPLLPTPMADDLAGFVIEDGVNIVGGCCGTTPAHITELIARIGDARQSDRAADRSPRLASSMRAIDARQVPPPLLIGERVNSQGSRAVKRMLLADAY